MSNSLPRVAFWLVPEKRVRNELASMIGQLADRFAAPIFLPHLTLYSCRRSVQQTELAICVRQAMLTPALATRVTGMATTEKLAKTLFFDLQNTPELMRLVRVLHASVPHPSTYQFDPHVSLLYQSLPASVREQLVTEVFWSSDLIRFDELRAVAIPAQIRTCADWTGWQTLMIMHLNELA